VKDPLYATLRTLRHFGGTSSIITVLPSASIALHAYFVILMIKYIIDNYLYTESHIAIKIYHWQLSLHRIPHCDVNRVARQTVLLQRPRRKLVWRPRHGVKQHDDGPPLDWPRKFTMTRLTFDCYDHARTEYSILFTNYDLSKWGRGGEASATGDHGLTGGSIPVKLAG
jgi:hypothetical protein